jgi:hypothetical protein
MQCLGGFLLLGAFAVAQTKNKWWTHEKQVGQLFEIFFAFWGYFFCSLQSYSFKIIS